MKATAFEYRHRYLVHGFIYTLGLSAPWSPLLPVPYRASVWSFVQNNSVWFLLSNALSKPSYLHFAEYWNTLLVVMILFAALGAGFRTWGAAYLGANTVQRGGMIGDRIVADGPFRFVRNPLYLGTLLHSVALAFLMRPEAAVLTLVLLTVVQMRLVGAEEPYLTERLGAPYKAYLAAVPSLIPSLRPIAASNDVKPSWKQGILSEVYMIGTTLTLLTVGWSHGYGWENSVLRVVQGIVISLGASVIARAFIPKAAF
ncbi:MAG: methyltransferase family protein [Janthinobacterium lividum]